MTKEHKIHLSELQQDKQYQLLLREASDRAAQGLLTLLVTVNIGAFITIIELLENHYWLLCAFTISTITAILSRTGIYYIYRQEVTMFDYSKDQKMLSKLNNKRLNWWMFTEYSAWASLITFTFGVIALTIFFIQNG